MLTNNLSNYGGSTLSNSPVSFTTTGAGCASSSLCKVRLLLHCSNAHNELHSWDQKHGHQQQIRGPFGFLPRAPADCKRPGRCIRQLSHWTRFVHMVLPAISMTMSVDRISLYSHVTATFLATATNRTQCLQGRIVTPFHFSCHLLLSPDSWPEDIGIKFLRECLAVEAEIGLPCVHETHRHRLFWNPWYARDLMRAVPEAKINCDLRLQTDIHSIWEQESTPSSPPLSPPP